MADAFKKMVRRVGKRQSCQVWVKGYAEAPPKWFSQADREKRAETLRIFEAPSMVSCSRMAKKFRKQGLKVEVVKARKA